MDDQRIWQRELEQGVSTLLSGNMSKSEAHQRMTYLVTLTTEAMAAIWGAECVVGLTTVLQEYYSQPDYQTQKAIVEIESAQVH